MRAMCEVQFKERKRSNDLMWMLGLNQTIDWLAMANSVCWHGHLLMMEDGHVMRRALVFEGQRKKGRLKKTWKKRDKEEITKVGLKGEVTLC